MGGRERPEGTLTGATGNKRKSGVWGSEKKNKDIVLRVSIRAPMGTQLTEASDRNTEV